MSPPPREQLLALVGELRPALHRYCARLTGSVFDGEDVVQDTLARGLATVDSLDRLPALRPWLFRIAHNRAIDVVRARRTGAAMSDEDADAPVSDASPDADLLRAEAVHLAVSRFLALPPAQRSAVILKDVLDLPLDEIGGVLDMTLDAVKGALARGRARLAALQAEPAPPPSPPSPAVARYVALFNAHDWDALRALLADDVQLQQSDRPRRRGTAEVGAFFTYYASYAAACPWRVAPAWLEGREVVAVFDPHDDPRPSYVTELTWRDGTLAFIRDFRYARYIVDGAEVTVARGA